MKPSSAYWNRNPVISQFGRVYSTHRMLENQMSNAHAMAKILYTHFYMRGIMTCHYLPVSVTRARTTSACARVLVMWPIYVCVVMAGSTFRPTNRRFIIRKIHFFCFFSSELSRWHTLIHSHTVTATAATEHRKYLLRNRMRRSDPFRRFAQFHHSNLHTRIIFDMLISTRCKMK